MLKVERSESGIALVAGKRKVSLDLPFCGGAYRTCHDNTDAWPLARLDK